MLTEQQSQFILGEVSEPVINAAKEMNFAARYDALLANFPKRPGDFNPQVGLVEQQALVAQFPHPIRFYKGEGGYYMLNEKKFTHPHMNLMIEMQQWVVFNFNASSENLGGLPPCWIV